MHILTLTAPLNVGGSIGTLQPGEWLLQDQNAFELSLTADRGTATLSRFESFGSESPHSVLIMRSGAIGDLLFMTPAIREYRMKHPNLQVHLCCRKEHWPLFENTTLFDSLVPYPYALPAKQDTYHEIISLENVMELSTGHATDSFAEALKVSVSDYTPEYHVTEDEKSIAKVWLKSKRPLVGIQIAASTKNRNYPLGQWATVILGLEAKGWEVLLFGLPGQIPAFPLEMQRFFVQDMSTKGLTFRETAALLSLCNAFVGVDSSLLHLCHALEIPAVGLYGPFDHKTRTAKAPLTRALTGEGECKHCHWHAKNGQHFPPMPCRKEKQCSVLASITPERILAKVDALKP